MTIESLVIIGETINDSVPSTKKLFDAGDIDGLLALAKLQDEKGATYIDVNVGPRTPEFMADMVKRVQTVTGKPLSIDSPDFETAKAGLEAYDPDRAGGALPVLNSISELRTEMFELYKWQPFKPILLVSEQSVDGNAQPCRTAEQTYEAGKRLRAVARADGLNIENGDLIIDPGIAPIATDSEGNLRRLVDALRLMQADPDFEGIHRAVGLSNFTVMLPPKTADGSRVKGPLESAFLTKTMPMGLDTIIGSVKRKYQLLDPDHPAMLCLEDVLKADGFDGIMRVQEFYS